MSWTWPKGTVKNLLPKAVQAEVKTGRQWALKGFVPVDPNSGKDLYTNGWYQDQYHYYHKSEVRPASKEELSVILGPERQRRAQLAKKREQRYAQIEADAWANIREELAQEQSITQMVRTNYRELCRSMADRLELTTGQRRRLVIDTETTGLDAAGDEILQLAILDADTGEVLMDQHFRPFYTLDWPEAQAVNGITPESAARQPFLVEKVYDIQLLLLTATEIIGYNTFFDIRFLEKAGFHLGEGVEITDVMAMYTAQQDEDRWYKLVECTADLGYDWGQDQAHDAVADCRATLYCCNKLC